MIAATASVLMADIQLPKIFSDKMVLQRGDSVNIWGTADPGEELTVTLGESSVTTQADDAGNWSIQLVPPPAGGPYELTIAGKDAQVVYNDVLVGEVWLCSGQSNMQWSMNQSLDFESDEERIKYFSEINGSRLRLFTVPANAIEEPASDLAGAAVWEECTPATVAEFSAVAYFFAKALQEHESLNDVPIGLIDSSWGGTPAEAWTSREALEAHANLAPLLEHWDANEDKRNPRRPAALYNGMIEPLIPLTIRGVVWYQGESNVGRANQYKTLFPSLIEDWRARFGQGNFPFYFVQLAPHRYGDLDPRALAELWDAQDDVLQLPNTGMAVSVDIGNSTDIHPKNKQIVGQRLACIALAETYGQVGLECRGPVYRSIEKIEDGSKLLIHLDFAEGLHHHGDSLNGISICGDDGEFVTAHAEIRDGKLVAWSDDIEKPAHVRYLWDDTAQGNLFNAAGLPASPFRTDDFEMLSVHENF
ncbi:MAG: sialate O-acetylesterase [Pirellulaceae bacterium]